MPALLLLLRRAGEVGEAVAEGQSRVDVPGDVGLQLLLWPVWGQAILLLLVLWRTKWWMSGGTGWLPILLLVKLLL